MRVTANEEEGTAGGGVRDFDIDAVRSFDSGAVEVCVACHKAHLGFREVKREETVPPPPFGGT